MVAATGGLTMSVEDQLGILDLISRHNHAFDYGDCEAYADCFTDDGIFENVGRMYVQGRQQFVDLCKRLVELGSPVRHWTTSALIEAVPGDPNAARLRLYLMLINVAGEKPFIEHTAHYNDQLVRVNGRWRFKHRVLTQDNEAHAPPPR
jgi:hypothetical protein